VIALVLRRLLALPLILLAIYTIALSLAWAIPGNPLENPEGRRPPPEVQAAMLAQYNLDSFPRSTPPTSPTSPASPTPRTPHRQTPRTANARAWASPAPPRPL
jgi:hypothetical protein